MAALEFGDREGCAEQWLTWARMRDVEAPVPSEVVEAAGITICTDVPRGVEGWADIHGGVVHVPPTADLVRYEANVGHEGTHHAQYDFGLPRGEQEITMAAVRLAWMMPLRSVSRLVSRHKLDLGLLIDTFCLVPPGDVVRRAIGLSHAAALLDEGHGSLRPIRSELYDVAFEPNRREQKELMTLSTKVRLTGRPAPWRLGIVAWPYRVGLSTFCAIVLDVERSTFQRAV